MDPRYLQPSEVNALCGDVSKAREKLGRRPEVAFGEPVERMLEADLKTAEREKVLRDAGHDVFGHPWE